MNKSKILVLDPGDSTGWVFRDEYGNVCGGTIKYDMSGIFHLFHESKPNIVVFENFTLHPGAAKAFTHNEFYPVQIIGIIKLGALEVYASHLVKLSPGVKRYAGLIDERWSTCIAACLEKPTEHMKDAYLLLKYFERYIERDKRKMSQFQLVQTL